MSDKPNDSRYEFTLDRRARDIESLIDHLEIKKPVTLVMHDWGGMIGMVFAIRRPELVKRLIFMNTAAFHLPKTKQLPPSLWLCRNTKLDDFIIRRSGMFCKLITRWGCCSSMSEQVREGYLWPHSSGECRLAHLRFVQDIPLQSDDRSYALVSEVEKKLPSFQKTPTLILWGEKDFVFDNDFLQAWEQKLPNAKVHRFPNAGHLILEDAVEEIVPIVREFVGIRG